MVLTKYHHKEDYSHMDIVTLLDTLLASIFKAEEDFFNNPNDFYSLESSVKSSTDSFAAGFLGTILSELNQSIRNSIWREDRYAVQRNDKRTLISSVGDITFDCTYYRGINGTKGFSHLLESYIGLDKNERFTEGAEVAILTEALKTSYAEATRVIPSKQKISKTTVMNKVHSIAEEIPDTIYDEPKAVPYLYIEADEDHVAEQHGRHGDKDDNGSFITKLIYIYEYKQDAPNVCGRKELVNKYYFSGLYPGEDGNRKLWTKVSDFIDNNYDYDVLRRIFVSGDGASWIKSGVNYLDKAVFCADKYHLMKYINSAAAQFPKQKEEIKSELWHLLYSKQKSARSNFDAVTADMLLSAKNPQRVEDLRSYVLGNWAAVRRTLRNKLVDGCSAESHVSHVLSDRLSSRPMGWSQRGADRMSKLRCFERNKGRGEIIQLVKYSRYRSKLAATGTDDIMLKKISASDVLANHYNQASSYIERIQAHIPFGTVKKIFSIREGLWKL